MRKGIHPHYEEIEVICSCGNTFKTCSTAKKNPLKIDVCLQCHPFSSGEQKVRGTTRLNQYRKKFGVLNKNDQKQEAKSAD